MTGATATVLWRVNRQELSLSLNSEARVLRAWRIALVTAKMHSLIGQRDSAGPLVGVPRSVLQVAVAAATIRYAGFTMRRVWQIHSYLVVNLLWIHVYGHSGINFAT